MIRSTDSGTYVWFPCVGRSDRKISWTVEEYLAYAKVSESEAELRCRLYDAGTISELTDQDRRELQYGGLTANNQFKKTRAKAVGL